MRVEYDPQVDILTIWLSDNGPDGGAEEVYPGVIIARDDRGAPVYVEILGAREWYGPDVEQFSIDALIPLAEAARRCGLAPDHLRHLAQRGRLKGKKLGGNWLTTVAWVEEYLQDRKYNAKKAPASG